MRLLQAILFGVGLAFPCVVVAQTAPTATEEFNLRIKCKQMADKKAENMEEGDRLLTDTKRIFESHASNYDPKSNRCYIEIIQQRRYGEFEKYTRQVYDAQTDDLLSNAEINKGEKFGIVYAEHKPTVDNNHGFDDANAYMDEKMHIAHVSAPPKTAKYTFTSPEGKHYTVDGPEGMTTEQAWQKLQQEHLVNGVVRW
jgi:hypothetical protein